MRCFKNHVALSPVRPSTCCAQQHPLGCLFPGVPWDTSVVEYISTLLNFFVSFTQKKSCPQKDLQIYLQNNGLKSIKESLQLTDFHRHTVIPANSKSIYGPAVVVSSLCRFIVKSYCVAVMEGSWLD